jgi:hypothetical protein
MDHCRRASRPTLCWRLPSPHQKEVEFRRLWYGSCNSEQQEETDTGGDDLDKLSPSADDATVLRTSAWAVGGSQDSREFQCSPRLGLLACAPYGCTQVAFRFSLRTRVREAPAGLRSSPRKACKVEVRIDELTVF